MNKTTKLNVAANLSVADVHLIQIMIEFFETRINDYDEEMYRALEVTLEEPAPVSCADMEDMTEYLVELRSKLDGVDRFYPESDSIITLEVTDTTPGRVRYVREDLMYKLDV